MYDACKACFAQSMCDCMLHVICTLSVPLILHAQCTLSIPFMLIVTHITHVPLMLLVPLL